MTDGSPPVSQRTHSGLPAGTFVLNLSTLALLFALAAPLIGVVSSYVLLRAQVESMRSEMIRIEGQIEAAMTEHQRIRAAVEYLCYARARDEREAGRPVDTRAC